MLTEGRTDLRMDRHDEAQNLFSHFLFPERALKIIRYAHRVYNNIYLTAIGLSPGGSGFKHIYKYLTLCY